MVGDKRRDQLYVSQYHCSPVQLFPGAFVSQYCYVPIQLLSDMMSQRSCYFPWWHKSHHIRFYNDVIIIVHKNDVKYVILHQKSLREHINRTTYNNLHTNSTFIVTDGASYHLHCGCDPVPSAGEHTTLPEQDTTRRGHQYSQSVGCYCQSYPYHGTGQGVRETGTQTYTVGYVPVATITNVVLRCDVFADTSHVWAKTSLHLN